MTKVQPDDILESLTMVREMESPRQVQNRRWQTREGPEPAYVLSHP